MLGNQQVWTRTLKLNPKIELGRRRFSNGCASEWIGNIPPKSILIVKKVDYTENQTSTKALSSLLTYLDRYNVDICCEKSAIDELNELDVNTKPYSKLKVYDGSGSKVDLVITLGGDGTMVLSFITKMNASNLFPKQCPPILSFSLGSLSFLIAFGTFILCLILRMLSKCWRMS
jgi:NAD kinase